MFIVTDDDTISFAGITAYNKEDNVYMTRFSDGKILANREARTWANKYIESMGVYSFYAIH